MENFPPVANERRRKWTFRSVSEVNHVANSILRQITVHERAKRWGKVIDAYRRLLWLIDVKHFPTDYEPPASHAILLYELHFHLGLALQRLGLHRKSIQHYTKAIEAVSIPKGGCLAGCMTNSCMMTPLYSRRAFAYTQAGDLGRALKDAESVVVLDNRNPDAYVIRSLVRASRNEERLALSDLDTALSFSPSHVACLVIRGAITRPLSPKYPGGPPRQNKYLVKAERLNPESQSYFHVDNFLHPCILDFYDRLLFTLLVPHTVTVIDMTPDKPTKKQLDLNIDSARSETISRNGNSSQELAFRCGTPCPGDNVLAAKRRRDYGEAVRKHNSRPKTAADFIAQLERDRQQRPPVTKRPMSAVPMTNSNHLNTNCPASNNQPPTSASTRSVSYDSRTKKDSNSSVRFPPGVNGTAALNIEGAASQKTNDRSNFYTTRRSRTASTKIFTFETPTNYTIPVFQPVNVQEAPRMYYRPWRGDKLPISEVHHPQPGPAFY